MVSVFAALALRIKREKIFVLSLFLGIFLLAFVCITLGNMFYTQAKDISALIAVSYTHLTLPTNREV